MLVPGPCLDAIREATPAKRRKTPVHALPSELLCLVFRAYLGHQHWTAPSSLTTLEPKRILTLTGVCAYWRDVVVNTPTFWTSIALEDSPRILELYLLRSRAITLDVFLVRPVFPNRWGDNVSVLQQHAGRIGSLDLHLKSATTSEGSWYHTTSLLSTPMPALTSLTLDGQDLDVFSLPPIDLDLFPCLQSLILREVEPSWNPAQMAELISLSLEGLLWQQQPTLDELLSLLAATPQLETFCFRNSSSQISSNHKGNAEHSPTREIVQLPRLKSFCVSESDPRRTLEAVLRYLRVPDSAVIEGGEKLASGYVQVNFSFFLPDPEAVMVTKWKQRLQSAFLVKPENLSGDVRCARSSSAY